ncbi:unnamed protein product [Clonostachys solani]|uniref:Uncharacterized protein n=1 Tax=Clonostachys solani TaxID=160281 RepID=A0A9N9YY72_9HYPO|nr:unnamed protein product [Clonostachys solani]
MAAHDSVDTEALPSDQTSQSTCADHELAPVQSLNEDKQVTTDAKDTAHSWLIALLAHLVIFSTWGFVNAFGAFQTYYVYELRIGGDSEVAWIGSTQLLLIFGVGIVAGRALDAGHYRAVFACGSLLYILGMFMLSLSTRYWHIFLSHAVCVGAGFGSVFAPTVALAGTYFDRHRALALGLMTIGSATGGMVFSAMAARMLPSHGFAWTVRTMGFVQLAITLICAPFLKPCTVPRKAGPLVEWSVLRDRAHVFHLLGAFFLFWSVFIGYYYLASYARAVVGASQSTGFYLLLTMNGVGVVGRVAVSLLGSRHGPVVLMVPAALFNALLGFCWAAVSGERGLWAFTVFFGTAVACIQAVYPMVLGSFVEDTRKAGAITGMGFFVAGVAAFTGPPVAGVLIQVRGGDYLGVQLMSGSSMVVAAVMYSICMILRRRQGLQRERESAQRQPAPRRQELMSA